MDVNFNKDKNGTIKLVFDYDFDETDKMRRQAFNDVKKNLRIDGFRKGKISYKMAQKLFGKDFLDTELIDRFVNPNFSDYLKEQNLNPLTQPRISSLEYDDDGSLLATIEFVEVPVFDINIFDEIKKVEGLEDITEENLQNDLEEENLLTLMDYLEKTPVDREIQDNDLVELEVLDSNYRYTLPKEISIVIGKENPYIDAELTKDLIGKKKGKLARLKDGNLFYDLKIKDNFEYKIPEFTEEFVKDNFDYDSVDEFKEFLERINEMSKSGRLSFKNGRAILENIVDETDIEISPLYIDQLKEDYKDSLNDLTKWDSMFSAEDSVEDNLEKLAKEYFVYTNLMDNFGQVDKSKLNEFLGLNSGTKFDDYINGKKKDSLVDLLLQLSFYRNNLEQSLNYFYQINSLFKQEENE